MSTLLLDVGDLDESSEVAVICRWKRQLNGLYGTAGDYCERGGEEKDYEAGV